VKLVRRLLRTLAFGTLALAAALALPATAPAVAWKGGLHYVAGQLPRGYEPYEVTGWRGLSSVWYRYRARADVELTVHTHTDGRCCYDVTYDERPIRVRGHRGAIASLVDEGVLYGRMIHWEERPGLVLEVVSQQRGLPDSELERIAARVRPAGAGEWRFLRTATTVVPSEHALRSRPRRVLARGVHGGRSWSFAVRLPRGYPLATWDRRVPCPELHHAGATLLLPYDCEQFPSYWRLVANQVFVYGALGARRIRRIRVRDYPLKDGDAGVVVPTHAVLGGRFRLYVAPMPRDTCGVVVEDADRHTVVDGNVPGYESERARCAA
jgi:hypothetical protein